ncbi:MAG: hypothetical protein WCO63_15260 [Bacteroidota bacterium]
MKNIKLVVEKLAHDQNRTIKEVYDYLGVSANAYYHMLKVNNIKASNLEKLCKFFKVQPCLFFEGECKVQHRQVENFDLMSRLNDTEKAAILDILLRHTEGITHTNLTDRLHIAQEAVNDFERDHPGEA